MADSEFEDAIQRMADATTAKMHVACPGVIVSYDPTQQKANVQPLIRGAQTGEPGLDGTATRSPIDHPIIQNVPIQWPSFGDKMIVGPLNPGDYVWLVFGDRSIAEWLTSSNPALQVTPSSQRRFALNDAVAFPSGRPFSKALELAKDAQDDDEIIFGEDSAFGKTLRIGPNGIRLGIDASFDNLNVLADTLTQLVLDIGALVPPSATVYAALLVRLNAIRKP